MTKNNAKAKSAAKKKGGIIKFFKDVKGEVKKKEKKRKLKKEKRVEKSRSQTLDTNALLKKKKDRNGV